MAIHEWWAGDAGEKYWMEITDRTDIGANLIAPKLNDGGRVTPSYSLVNYVTPGDVVFHWDKGSPGPRIASYSIVKDVPFSSIIEWDSRGTYGRAKTPVGKPPSEPAWEAPLTGHAALQAPVTQERIRQLEKTLRTVHDDLQAQVGSPLYFPFDFSDKRPIRAAQGYLFKFPRALVDAIPDLGAILELGEGPAQLGDEAPPNAGTRKPAAKPPAVGTGRLRDPVRKKAIETYAVQKVMKLWQADGYEVEDVGLVRPWDITASKDGTEVHIEVKGSSVTRETVDLTDGEVRHAEGHSPTVLVVVDQINVTSTNACSGGRVRIWEDWLPDRYQLIPTAYRYPLPG